MGYDPKRKILSDVKDVSDKFFETIGGSDDNPRKILRSHIEPEIRNKNNGWEIYDTKFGHCAYCGYLHCNGRCCGGM